MIWKVRNQILDFVKGRGVVTIPEVCCDLWGSDDALNRERARDALLALERHGMVRQAERPKDARHPPNTKFWEAVG